MKKIAFLSALLALLGFPAALAHSDEFGEATSIHFMHRGALKFPVWSYYAEIVEHLAMFIAAAVALYLVYKTFSKFHIERKEILNFFMWGFLFIGIGELLTLLHHFLIYPLGIFNAIFNHAMLLIAIILLCIGFVKLIRYEEGKKRKR